MNIDVIMPKMGESITGELFSSGKKMLVNQLNLTKPLEISTDKVDSEIPSHLKV